VSTLLEFWRDGRGEAYNPHRKIALDTTELASSFAQVYEAIEAREGKAPLVLATSAREIEGIPQISYFDQATVWAHNRPVLLLLGTGRGMSEALVRKADYLLMPVRGFSDFNHLSVRSAAAIIFDRWLGIHPKMVDF
jgi:hypothetical protein